MSDHAAPLDTRMDDDPTVAQASHGEWRLWIDQVLASGADRLGKLGLALFVGLIGVFFALLLFVFVADNVLDRETQQLDQSVLAWVHQFSSPELDLAARRISALGSEALFVFAGALLVALGIQRRWGAAVALVLAVGGAQLVNDVLKSLVHRARPTPVGSALLGQAYSFPSGHAMMSMAFYLFVGYLGWRLLQGWHRWAWCALLAVVVVLVGLSRLYLQVHYPTDVLGGYLAGFVWADAVIIGGHLLRLRRQPIERPKNATPLPAQ